MALETDSWMDLPLPAHQQRVAQRTAQGFRLRAMSLYHVGGQAVYAAAMVKEAGGELLHVHHLLSPSQWLATVSRERQLGYAPTLVSASGPSAGPSFAAVFSVARALAAAVRVESNLTAAQFKALNDELQLGGMILRAMDAYGAAGSPRYVGVWWPNTERTAWNCTTLGATQEEAQANFDGMRTHWARPALSVMAPGGRRTACYVDDQVGEWSSRSGLSPAEFAAYRDEQEAAGRVAVSLSVRASGTAGVQREVAAIFAQRTTPQARSFRSLGAGPQEAPQEGIDEVMRNFIVNQRIRGAALAIVQGTRLVYARGYTWAEPGYPDVRPDTLFRLGSVTKVFCGAAIWQLLARGPKSLSLDDSLQSILKLKTPGGTSPVDPRFADITIRHLLEGTSGLFNQRVDVEAAQAFGKPLPSTVQQQARFVAGQMLTAQPGNDSKAAYLNVAYRMLALVVAKKRQAASIDAAFRQQIFDPLGMQRTRPAVSDWAQQPPNHARHHVTQVVAKADNRPLALVRSVSTPDRPLVASAYGGLHLENYVGSGGYAAAVVDMARFAAALSDRDENPLMPFEDIQAWLGAAAATTQRLKGVEGAHGYYGFDGASLIDGADGPAEDRVYRANKGGSLPGVGASLDCTTNGGFSYALVINTTRPAGDKSKWRDPVDALAQTVDWQGKDLFPAYGMPSLSPRRITIGPAKPLPKWLRERFDGLEVGGPEMF